MTLNKNRTSLQDIIMSLEIGKTLLCELYNISVNEYDNLDEIEEQREAEELLGVQK